MKFVPLKPVALKVFLQKLNDRFMQPCGTYKQFY